jgi:hypothetical protein
MRAAMAEQPAVIETAHTPSPIAALAANVTARSCGGLLPVENGTTGQS